MTTHGIGSIRLTGDTAARRISEAYVSLIRFLTSSYAEELGIQRIAYNTGSATSGQNYWDETGAVGNNAFSVYRFMSASYPFNMMLQYTVGGSTFGSAPGAPGTVDAGTSGNPNIGIAFASRADGANAWNGTTLNNGNDAKSATLVWTSGSSTLFALPRSNSGGGTHATLKQNTTSITQNVASAFATRVNAVFSEDSIFIAIDNNDYLSTCTFIAPYTPMTSSIMSPYVMVRSVASDDPALALSTTTYGDTAGSAVRNGGACHPYPPSSSLGTMICAFTYINNNLSTTSQPNTATTGSTTFKYDEFPIHVCLYETAYYGYVGYITNWPKIAYGVPQLGVTPAGDKLFVGGIVGPNGTKFVVPWSGSVGSPGAGVGRAGVMF